MESAALVFDGGDLSVVVSVADAESRTEVYDLDIGNRPGPRDVRRIGHATAHQTPTP